MKHPRRLVGALALLSVLGAACSDDGTSPTVQEGQAAQSTTSSTVAAPTKGDFIAAADAICAKYTAMTDPMFGTLFTAGDPQPSAVQETFGKVLDLYDQQQKELRALTPPADQRDQVNALWTIADQSIAQVRGKIATADGAMGLLASEDDPFAAANAKAKEFGMKDCAGEGEQKTQAFGGVQLTAEEQAKATKVSAEGFEYGYKGMSATIPAGPATFSFRNTGVEDHELGIIKITKGMTAAQAIAKAKANPDDESYVEQFLGAGYALKGESIDLSVKLEPGLYGYGCFIETADGTPHAVKGMISTFTVR